MGLFERNLSVCGQDIEITDRNVKIFNGLPTEIFSGAVNVRAILSTLSGVKVFDDTNTERVATHKLCIAYIDGVTAEKWVKLANKKRLKVLTVENCCEKNEKLILVCTERGLDSKVVNNA